MPANRDTGEPEGDAVALVNYLPRLVELPERDRWGGHFEEFPGLYREGAGPEETRCLLIQSLNEVVRGVASEIGAPLPKPGQQLERTETMHMRLSSFEKQVLGVAKSKSNKRTLSEFVRDAAMREAFITCIESLRPT